MGFGWEGREEARKALLSLSKKLHGLHIGCAVFIRLSTASGAEFFTAVEILLPGKMMCREGRLRIGLLPSFLRECMDTPNTRCD